MVSIYVCSSHIVNMFRCIRRPQDWKNSRIPFSYNQLDIVNNTNTKILIWLSVVTCATVNVTKTRHGLKKMSAQL